MTGDKALELYMASINEAEQITYLQAARQLFLEEKDKESVDFCDECLEALGKNLRIKL